MAKRNSTPLNSERHFVEMAEWLALEFQAEVERMAERRKRLGSDKAERSGETLLDMAVTDHTRGLGGRYLITFGRRNRSRPMPWHRLSTGSPVVVSNFDEDDGSSLTGVVSARRPDSIQVALDRWPDWQCFRIDLSADEVTRQRMMTAIRTSMEATGRLGQLREVTMGNRPPEFGEPEAIDFRTRLNASQQQAIAFCLSARDIAVIHGPPGTGKTTTLAELIAQATDRGDRVLVCAPTNTAVDNLLERLIDLNQKVVRLGHPARVDPRLHEFTLDGLVEQSEEMDIIKSMRRQADDLFRQADRYTRAKPARGQKAELRREAKELLQHARLMEKQTIQHLLDQAEVVCATTTLNESLVGDRRFDLLVIDEACQSVEPGCWIPMLRCDRVVLAGDHFQLPPTILSREAAKAGLEISLMQRLCEQYGQDISRMLTVQYRMHDRIKDFSSGQFYAGQLESDPAVAAHRLSDLPDVTANALTESVFEFIDTAGAGWDEEQESEGLSRLNPREAALVLHLTRELVECGVRPGDIAVIAPYAAQARLIRNDSPYRDLEVDTVDGFQGREKEAVIISLVRSNERSEIGFLAETRRMNVAMTRARRKLVVIGDSATIGNHPFYSELLDYVQSIDGYRSVWEIDADLV